MAQIEGLNEQKEALKRINSNLKELADINALISNVRLLAEDKSIPVSYDITISFSVDQDIKRFKSAVIFDNNQSVLDAVNKYRSSVVAKIKDDSTMYRISLSPQEHELLDGPAPLG